MRGRGEQLPLLGWRLPPTSACPCARATAPAPAPRHSLRVCPLTHPPVPCAALAQTSRFNQLNAERIKKAAHGEPTKLVNEQIAAGEFKLPWTNAK